jgi:hypothetical protein
MMGPNTFYCSELSRAASEKSFGTASLGEVWLLIEYPFAWGPKAFDDSNLAPAIKSRLQRFIRSVPRARLLFIKQGSVCHERVSIFLVRCREREPLILKFELEDYRQLTELDLEGAAAGQTGAEVSNEPLFLVCTHGRRDKCCAKFGNPLFKALRAAEGAAAWQSSHVGGDRFAANLVCFPHGLFYSHMTAEAGQAVTSEYRAGRLSLQNYRGRACYPYPVQAAEFFARKEGSASGVDELRRLDGVRLGEDRWQVRFLEPRERLVHRVELSRHLSAFQNPITCHSGEARPVMQFRLDAYERSALET